MSVEYCRTCKMFHPGEECEIRVKVYEWTFSINAPTEADPFQSLPLSVADIGYSDKLLRLDLAPAFVIVPKSLITELESRKGEYAWIDDLLSPEQSKEGKM